jgi:hypothetical protein
MEQKKKQTIGIPFQTLPRKSKQLGNPFPSTKIEANSGNAVPKHPTEEKTTQNKTQQPFYDIFTQFVAEYSKRGRVRGRVWMNYTLIKPNMKSM